MSRWREVVAAEPAFAERVLRIIDQRKHKTLATLRADGSPRISGCAVAGQRPDRPTPPANWFRIEIEEAVLTYVSDPPDILVIESWHPGRGLQRRLRK